MPTIAKRNAKDTVFTNLFSHPKYLLSLYQALHPEDQDITEDMLETVTIQSVLTDHRYNDLGFIVKNRLVILVEAQSSWSVNILVRSFMYLAQTYQERFEERKVNLYSSAKIELPVPELYVIYTGERKEHPEELVLSQEFFGGAVASLEVRVKVLYGDDKEDIIGQYVRFCKVYTTQIREKGRTAEAVEETLRICRDENVLREFLLAHEKEVVDIMMMLFDENYIREAYEHELIRKGEARGESKGRILQSIEIYRDEALDDETILQKLMDKFHLTLNAAREWLNRFTQSKNEGHTSEIEAEG